MAISSPVHLTSCKSELWGSVTTAAASLEKLGETINDSSPHNLTSFNGVSASFSCTGSLSFSGIGDSKYLGITGNCAWSFELTTGSGYFYNPSVNNASANIGSGVYGGNGNIIVQRNTTPGSGSGSITITYSNGSGGETTTTVSLSFS
jgi:hypothetical protein